ncbi:MAG: hypothetical protein D6690_06060 [Nitrospirae bacterium]|nr:MAG: hypothetical protein D6690_06060 [Nitrospirota bacterium]
MSMRHVQLLALGLSLCGLGLFGYKAFILGFPLTPHVQTELWTVEVHLKFVAKRGRSKSSCFCLKAHDDMSYSTKILSAMGMGS